tara:strand:- start:13845 stop:14798 length:954 start_codon:yes stop_codon:yes gene_type:complete
MIHIVLGGTYFLEEKVAFFDNDIFKEHSDNLIVETVDWEVLAKKKKIELKGDAVFVFGVKRWARKLKKQRLGTGQIVDRISDFLEKSFGRNIPIGILEDLEIKSSRSIGRALTKKVLKKFNCKVVLLREYLKKESYPDLVHPFAISSIDRSELCQDPLGKKTDIYFRGDTSSPERADIVKAASKIPANTDLSVYKGGAKSAKKLPPDQFFKNMAASKICLSMMGNGYSCYRYQEVPSVGSILATSRYPLITPNDYEDMKSCIKFKNVHQLSEKVKEILDSKQRVVDMTNTSIECFKKYHSTDRRFEEFMNYVEVLKC